MVGTHRRSRRGPARKRSRRRGRLAGGLALLIIMTGGIGHALVSRVDRDIRRVDAFGGVADRPDATGGKNFLLVGTDGRDGITADQKKRFHLGGVPCHCTDTIMLIHLSADRSRMSVVSIPRDSYVELPAHDEPFGGKKDVSHHDKINAAYAHGGPKLTVRTVEKLTGVRIDHYLEVDFTSFMRTVDVLGGVPVCTTHPLQDSSTGLDLPAGTSMLSGGQALQYVRSRRLDSGSDLGRMQRQQRFVAQFVEQATSADVLANPARLDRFASAVLGSVRADQELKPADLITLAQGLRGFPPGSSEFTSVPVVDADHPVPGVGSTVKWDEAGARKLWAALREDRPLAAHRTAARRRALAVEVDPAKIRVQVDNGTSVADLGRRADSALRATGFDTTRTPGTAAERRPGRTLIRYDPRWNRSAHSLAAALPGARLQPVPGQGAVMRVVLGQGHRGVRGVRPGAAEGSGTMTGDEAVCP